MDEMVERVARAYDPVGWAWYDSAPADHPAKPVFLADKIGRMKTAIEAMREPTGAMQAMGRDVLATWLPRGELSRAPDNQWHPSNEIWRAMIDAALGEAAERKVMD